MIVEISHRAQSQVRRLAPVGALPQLCPTSHLVPDCHQQQLNHEVLVVQIDAETLIIAPASDAHLESKASALACRPKAEALDSTRPALRLPGTMTKADIQAHADKRLKPRTPFQLKLRRHSGRMPESSAMDGNPQRVNIGKITP
jgi:hypothetical protein